MEQLSPFGCVANTISFPAELEESEQLRPAILFGRGHHNSRDEHVFSLFQVL
jgi:hypothetical protein